MNEIKEKIRKKFSTAIDTFGLDVILAENTSSTLERAFGKFLESETKYPGYKSFENQVRWANDKSDRKDRSRKDGSKINDLIVQNPEYTQKIRLAENDGFSHAAIYELIRLWGRTEDLKKKLEIATKLWKITNQTGKKKVIEKLVYDIFSSGYIRRAWQVTRKSIYHNESGNSKKIDVDQEAYKIAIIHYLEKNIGDVEDHIVEVPEKFDSYEYFCSRMLQEYKKRGVT